MLSSTPTIDPGNSNNQLGGGDRNNTDDVDGLSTCFPADATVTLDSGAVIAMSELTVGDRVLVGDGSFSEVLLFTHSNAVVPAWFLRLETQSGRVLVLTKGHYLLVNDLVARADTISVGDTVNVAVLSSHRYKVQHDRIVDVKRWLGLGLYNPQTRSGDIVVDGIVASCYTEAVSPVIAHAMLAPVRGLANFGVGWLQGAVAATVAGAAKRITG